MAVLRKSEERNWADNRRRWRNHARRPHAGRVAAISCAVDPYGARSYRACKLGSTMETAMADIESGARFIVRRLREAGFQAFFAGGCVRDKILGLAPKDYDIAT